MAEEQNETQVVAEESGGGMMKMIMFGGISIALLVAGVFAGPAIKDMISSPPAEDVAVEDGAPANAEPAIYQSLHPPIVINFKDSFGDSHFMQITMEVMSRDQEVINAVREHTPVIRNALILMFGAADYDVVTTREGKEQMHRLGRQRTAPQHRPTAHPQGVRSFRRLSVLCRS